MTTITIRSLAQTCAEAGHAARQLGRVANGQRPAFMRAAWRLAEMLAPLGSAPLSYWLNPTTYTKYWGLTRLGESTFVPDILTPHGKLIARYVCTPNDKEFLLVEAREATGGATAGCELPRDPARRWIFQYLVGLRYPTGLPNGLFHEGSLHLSAFFAFHMGDVRRFSSAMIGLDGFKALPRFWRAFLRWHAVDRGNRTTVLLRQTALDVRESPGKRKAALLLLWTDSTASVGRLRNTTKRIRRLLNPRTPYRGSGPLPVLPELPALVPTKRNVLEVTRELIEAARKVATNPNDAAAVSEKQRLTEELLGAKAALPPIREMLKPANLLRALIVGACPDERYAVAWTLAGLSGISTAQWRTWTTTKWDADAISKLQNAVQDWCTNHEESRPLLAEIADCLLIAREFSKWDRRAAELLADLLVQRLGSDGKAPSWPRPVIGTLDSWAEGCRLTMELERASGWCVTIPPLNTRPHDIAAYAKAIVAKLQSARTSKAVFEITDDAIQEIQKRLGSLSLHELQHVVLRAVEAARSEGSDKVSKGHVKTVLRKEAPDVAVDSATASEDAWLERESRSEIITFHRPGKPPLRLTTPSGNRSSKGAKLLWKLAEARAWSEECALSIVGCGNTPGAVYCVLKRLHKQIGRDAKIWLPTPTRRSDAMLQLMKPIQIGSPRL